MIIELVLPVSKSCMRMVDFFDHQIKDEPLMLIHFYIALSGRAHSVQLSGIKHSNTLRGRTVLCEILYTAWNSTVLI